LESLTCVKLKALLVKMQLPVSGRKAELIERIRKGRARAAAEAAAAEAELLAAAAKEEAMKMAPAPQTPSVVPHSYYAPLPRSPRLILGQQASPRHQQPAEPEHFILSPQAKRAGPQHFELSPQPKTAGKKQQPDWWPAADVLYLCSNCGADDWTVAPRAAVYGQVLCGECFAEARGR